MTTNEQCRDSAEQVIQLLLAGGFVTQAKVDQAREILANCAPAVPVESLGRDAEPVSGLDAAMRARGLPEVADALGYSRNFAAANPHLTQTTKDHITGLCDMLELASAHQTTPPTPPPASVPDGWLLGWARAAEIEKTQRHRSKREGSALAVFVHAEKNETYSAPVYAPPTNQEGAAP